MINADEGMHGLGRYSGTELQQATRAYALRSGHGIGCNYRAVCAKINAKVTHQALLYRRAGHAHAVASAASQADPLTVIKDVTTGAALLVPRSQLGRG